MTKVLLLGLWDEARTRRLGNGRRRQTHLLANCFRKYLTLYHTLNTVNQNYFKSKYRFSLCSQAGLSLANRKGRSQTQNYIRPTHAVKTRKT